jgi:hypothetical protein
VARHLSVSTAFLLVVDNLYQHPWMLDMLHESNAIVDVSNYTLTLSDIVTVPLCHRFPAPEGYSGDTAYVSDDLVLLMSLG